MKKISILFIIGVMILITSTGSCQQQTTIKSLDQLPENWELKETAPYSYISTTTHYDYFLLGSFFQKTQITGKYTRGLEGGKVKWKDVYISQSNSLNDPFEKGDSQANMENFTYSTDEDMLAGDKYVNFPPNSHMLKNLIWDISAFETFAWLYTDSLTLHEVFIPKEISVEMDLAGQGTFENKEICLTWTGITLKNNVQCAIIKFSVLNNPLSMKSDFMTMKGRSHYWGEVYVSLDTKQIEYAELFEDVVIDMKITSQETNQMLNTVRTIVLERVQ